MFNAHGWLQIMNWDDFEMTVSSFSWRFYLGLLHLMMRFVPNLSIVVSFTLLFGSQIEGGGQTFGHFDGSMLAHPSGRTVGQAHNRLLTSESRSVRRAGERRLGRMDKWMGRRTNALRICVR